MDNRIPCPFCGTLIDTDDPEDNHGEYEDTENGFETSITCPDCGEYVEPEREADR